MQYLSIRYTERLAEAGIEPSVGSVGDSYDNALAETINGLYKTEVIHPNGPWRNVPPAEFEGDVRCNTRKSGQRGCAQLNSGEPGAVHS